MSCDLQKCSFFFLPSEGNSVKQVWAVRGLPFALTILSFCLSLSVTPTPGLFQDLMEQLEKQDRTIRKLKKQLKVYSKRIGEMGGMGEIISQRRLENLYACVCLSASVQYVVWLLCPLFFFPPAGQTEGQTSPGQMVDEPIHPVNIPRREKDFQGMLEYKKEDELKLVKNLILGKN